MADELDRKNKNENEEMGRTTDENMRGEADENEEFEDIDDDDDDDDEDDDDAVDVEL